MCVFAVRTSKNTGVMFLCEVALGKEHTITKDNPALKKAPAGFDSVVARGLVEPGTLLLHLYYTFAGQHAASTNKCAFLSAKPDLASELKSHKVPSRRFGVPENSKLSGDI